MAHTIRVTTRGTTIIIAFLLLGFPGFLAIPETTSGTGDNLPPLHGDWIIGENIIVDNETLLLNGSLIIQPGGNLTLINTTLSFNCSYDGEFGIEVQSGGKLQLVGSKTVTHANPSGPQFPYKLYVGSNEGENSIYRNHGTIEQPKWIFDGFALDENGTNIEVTYNSKLTFADLDADGDQDFVIGTTDGPLVYFENTGTQADPIWTRNDSMFPTDDYGGNSSPAFADLDGDGDLDGMIGNYDGTFCYLENIGTETDPEWNVDWDFFSSLDLGFLTNPTLGDIDGDGDFDLVSGEYGEVINYFENTGSKNEPQWTDSSDTFNSFNFNKNLAPKLFDYDGDGDIDLIMGETLGNIICLENNGTIISPAWIEDDTSFSQISVGYSSSPAFYLQVSQNETNLMQDSDIKFLDDSSNTDDGTLDLLLGVFAGDLNFFENTGLTDATEWSYDSIAGYGINAGTRASPEFGDLDGDGDLDILLGCRDDSFQGRAHYLENTGTSYSPYWEERGAIKDNFGQEVSGQYYLSPELADLDNDGDLDLTTGDYDGLIMYYENVGTTSSPEWAEGTSTPFEGLPEVRYCNPSLEDLDGDGDFDLTIGYSNGDLIFYWNTGTPEESEWTHNETMFQNIEVSSMSAPEFGDLDGDGDLDLVIGNSIGQILIVTNIGDAGNPVWESEGFARDRFGEEIDMDSFIIPALADVADWTHDATNNGGNETIWHHSIQSISNYTYYITVDAGGALDMRDMRISACEGGEPGPTGCTIRTNNAIVNGSLFEDNKIGLTIDSSGNVQVVNNTFRCNSTGISIINGTNHTINENIFTGSGVGIELYNTSDSRLSRNTFSELTTAILLTASSDNSFHQNSIYSVGTGISIVDSSGNQVSESTISNCSLGIILEDTRDHEIRNVTFQDCGLAIVGDTKADYSTHNIEESMVNGLPLRYFSGGSDISVTEETGQLIVVDCSEVSIDRLSIEAANTGILLAFVTEGTVTNTSLRYCTFGIDVVNSDNISITNTSIRENGIGIRTRGLTNDISIHKNIISENVILGIQNAIEEYQNISAEWNYWGAPSGPHQATANPSGNGDNVTDHVNFRPWLLASPGENEWVVDPSAHDNGIGTEASPFNRIQQAVDTASPGDSIYLLPGTYKEQVVIHSSLKIYGPDGTLPGQAILDGMGGSSLTIDKPCIISNLTLADASKDMILGADVRIYNTSFSTVEFLGESQLFVGHYLDVRLQDRSGIPLNNALLIVENDHLSAKTFLSDSNGDIKCIPLIEKIISSTGTTTLPPYYLNASSDIGHINHTHSIVENTQITLNLSRHGAFGETMVIADLDGDGYDDYVVGAPQDSIEGWQSGVVFIYFGSPSFAEKQLKPENADITLQGNSENKENQRLGNSMTIDDINQDGMNDLIITGSGIEGQGGIVYLLSGTEMEDRIFTLSDAMALTPPPETSGYNMNNIIETADIDADGFPDILVGYTGGIMIFHGQWMIDREDFSQEPTLSEQWDPIISGNDGVMRIDDSHDSLKIDTTAHSLAFAYAMSRDSFTNGLQFSITVGNGNVGEVIFATDYKISSQGTSDYTKQLQHSLFQLRDSGLFYLTPVRGGTQTILNGEGSGSSTTFTFFVSQDFSTLTIYKDGLLLTESKLSGWSELYLKIGDSYRGVGSRAEVHNFQPTLLSSILPGLSNCAKVTHQGVDHLAFNINNEVYLMPLHEDPIEKLTHSFEEDFDGTFNHTLFDDGITINDLIHFDLFPNGDFEDGWDNWTLIENEHGNNTAGRRTIMSATNMDWYSYEGPTGGFGADKDFLTGNKSPSEGRLRTENVTIPMNTTYLSFWNHWKAVWFDADDGGYPDSIRYLLRYSANDSVAMILDEFIATDQNQYVNSQDIHFIDISSLRGETVYLSIDIVANNDQGDQALAQIDELLGVEIYSGTTGEYISSMYEFPSNYTTFLPKWGAVVNNGAVTLFYRTNETHDWTPMDQNDHNMLNASSFQYRIILEVATDNPYPVVKSMDFTFYNFLANPIGTGISYNVGDVYDQSTLAILSSESLVIHNGSEPWITITNDVSIDQITGIGDVNGDSVSDVFVSSNDTVYLVFLSNTQGTIDLQDSEHYFSGLSGFGSSLDGYMVGSPWENQGDGGVYLLPTYLEDCSIIGADLANNSLLYPGEQITINVSLLNRGLQDAPLVNVTMQITSEEGYLHTDNIMISLDSWNSDMVQFLWDVPNEEGVIYTITFSIPADHNPANDVLLLEVQARYHALSLETQKEYDTVLPNGELIFEIVAKNLGTFGADTITISCDIPQNWTWSVTWDGSNTTGFLLEEQEIILLHVIANGTLGDYPVLLTITSGNGWITDDLELTGFISDRDLTPVVCVVFRADGKEGTPISGETTTLELEVKNLGVQTSSSTIATILVNGVSQETSVLPEVEGNSSTTIFFQVIFQEGDQHLSFIVDTGDHVPEYNENNNILNMTIAVGPEYASTAFQFNIIVKDIHNHLVNGSQVEVDYSGYVISGSTDIDGTVVLILEPPYLDGSQVTIIAFDESLFSSTTFQVYSEDIQTSITLVLGRYSIDLASENQHQYLLPGENTTFTILVKNLGDFDDTYDFSLGTTPHFLSADFDPKTVSSNGLAHISKDEHLVITLNVSSDEFAPAHSLSDISIKATSQTAPLSIFHISFSISILLVDDLSFSAESTNEFGSPGDPISHRLSLSNQGNEMRNVSMFHNGSLDCALLSNDEFSVRPGMTIDFWITITIPNIRAGSVLTHEVHGMISGIGTTDSIQFITSVEANTKFSRFLIDLSENALTIQNNGNIDEHLSISFECESLRISPTPSDLTIDMGETVMIPLEIDVIDLTLSAGSQISTLLSIKSGDSYINSTRSITIPQVWGLIMTPIEHTVCLQPGGEATFRIEINNTGNCDLGLVFDHISPDGIIVNVPRPQELTMDETRIVSLSVLAINYEQGSIPLSLLALNEAGDPVGSCGLTLDPCHDHNLTLKEIKVKSNGRGTVYTINIENHGLLCEKVEFTTNSGELDILITEIEPEEIVQFHLTIPYGDAFQPIIFVNATNTVDDSLIVSLPLLPPPLAQIDIESQGPFTTLDVIFFEAAGNYKSYIWTLEGRSIPATSLQYQFATAGNHTVSLMVRDSRNLTSTATVLIVIDNRPPNLKIPTYITGKAGKPLAFDTSRSEDPDGNIIDFIWTIENQTYHGIRIYHTFTSEGSYTVNLTISDDMGATNSTEFLVTITKGDTTPTDGKDIQEIDSRAFAVFMVVFILVIVVSILLINRHTQQEDELIDILHKKEVENNAIVVSPHVESDVSSSMTLESKESSHEDSQSESSSTDAPVGSTSGDVSADHTTTIPSPDSPSTDAPFESTPLDTSSDSSQAISLTESSSAIVTLSDDPSDPTPTVATPETSPPNSLSDSHEPASTISERTESDTPQTPQEQLEPETVESAIDKEEVES